jgi:hypothetical protein
MEFSFRCGAGFKEGLRTPCADKISNLWIVRAKLCRICADLSMLFDYSRTDIMHTIFHILIEIGHEVLL